MSRIAILVEFDPVPALRDEFLHHLRDDAQATLCDDGCMRMDVLIARDGSGRVILSELWRDMAAIEAHKAKPGHTHAWQEPLLRSKRVTTCDVD